MAFYIYIHPYIDLHTFISTGQVKHGMAKNIKLTNQSLEVWKFIIIWNIQHWQDDSSAETIGKTPAQLLLMVYTTTKQSQEKQQL